MLDATLALPPTVFLFIRVAREHACESDEIDAEGGTLITSQNQNTNTENDEV